MTRRTRRGWLPGLMLAITLVATVESRSVV